MYKDSIYAYLYEDYGETYSVSNTSSMTAPLSNANMLTYRGYVLDKGTGLYYLQSRYYDPNVGRFINADKYFSGVGGDILGNNMFAYCFNNPVNFDDISGNWPNFVNKAASLFKSAVKAAATAVKAAKDTIQNAIKDYNITVSRGFTQSFAFFIFNASVVPSISVDTKGNVETQLTISGGITLPPTKAASTCTTTTITNAPSVDKLQGDAVSAGGSYFYPITYGLAVGGNIDAIAIPDYKMNKQYYGASFSGGISPTAGGEGHIGYGYTWPWFSFNIFNELDRAYDAVMEW